MTYQDALDATKEATNVVYLKYASRAAESIEGMLMYPKAINFRPDATSRTTEALPVAWDELYYALRSTVREFRALERIYKRTGELLTAQQLIRVGNALDAMVGE